MANNIVSKIMRVFGIDKTEVAVMNDQTEYRSVSDKELKSILKGVYVPDNMSNRRIIDKMSLPAMLAPIGQELVDRQINNTKLLTLAPEIEQAASILIPSILSPNDFSKNIFKVVLELDDIDETAKVAITDLINKHFGDSLSLSSKLSLWLDDAIFKVGSKAIMVFPTSSIAKVIADTSTSVESVSSILLTKVQSSDIKLTYSGYNSIFDDNTFAERFDSALESIEFDSKVKDSKEKFKTHIIKHIKTLSKDPFASVNLGSITYTDDPSILFHSKVSNAAATEAITNKVFAKLGNPITRVDLGRTDWAAAKKTSGSNVDKTIQYRSNPYLDLSDYIKDGATELFPAMIELPSEAVLPIIIEGSPENHIGYFIMLNEYGNPITAETDSWQSMMNNTNMDDPQTNQLFNAFYGSANFSLSGMMSTSAKQEIVGTIYESYVRKLLKGKLDESGFRGLGIQMNNDVSRVMLYRLMKNLETRILFVPKQLLHYLAFDYHQDGTGRSKIDQIKFPLSLKLTLIITRLISLIESAVNRTKLNISLDDTVGNPLEVLRSIRKKVLESKMHGISYDPSTIIKGIVEKSLTIVPDRIPGVESFNISEEPNNVSYPVPDESLLSEINNMYMLSLDVPPSAMNRLGEDEFSRSVASNNIFFSNKLKGHQTTTCDFMTDLIRNYTRHSKYLVDAITNILNSKDKKGAKEEEQGSADVNKVDNTTRVIENLFFSLPSPCLAIDRSSFEELREYIDIIEQVLVNILPPEIAANSELGDTISALKSNIKHKLLMEHISSNSILSGINFDVFGDINIKDITDVIQKLMNLKKALDLQKSTIGGGAEETGGEAEPSSGGASW